MPETLQEVSRQRDRLARRVARERDARAQAEAIAERTIRELAQSHAEVRQRAAELLRESEARTQAILDSTIDAIVTIDEGGVIQSTNPATERIFGYSAHEMVGQNVSMLMPAPHRGHHDGYIRAYLETGQAKVIGTGRETVALRKDGTLMPIDLAVTEVRGSGQRLFTGIVRDISARKAAQRRLEETLVDLRRSRDDLLATLNQLRVGTLMVDAEDRITFLSESCTCLEGVDPAAARGQRWDEVLPLDQRAREALRAMLRTDEGQRTRLGLGWQGPSGRDYRVEVDIRDDPRNPAGRIAYLYDVSEVHALRTKLASADRGQMTGTSAPMRQVYARISEVAQGDWTVLIQGETGVGKELVARAIHAASGRSRAPFVAVNCAGLTDSLLESQLFGHRRGAFTGAVADQQGLFEAAAGGTLLLDEIGDVSVKVQTSLLRVIQEREVLRVGEARPRKVDVRLLVATHRDLEQEVAAGRFRQDLLYRIRVARVQVPPLRQRAEDIPLLVADFLAQQRLATGRPVLEVDPAAMQALTTYPWPGNVRELKSAVEHAVIGCQGSVICLHDLPPELAQGHQPTCQHPAQPAEGARWQAADAATPPRTAPDAAPATLPATAGAPATLPATAAGTLLASAPGQGERDRILAALAWAEGNRARAARRLGISRATLYRRLRELGVGAKRG